MPIYSEQLENEVLLSKLDTAKKVSIVGCGACANISYNIAKYSNEPAMNIFRKPYALIKECNLLKNYLKDRNIEAESVNFMSLCVNSKKTRKKLEAIAEDTEALIVLSCKAGVSTINNEIKNKKIVHGMQVKGFKSIKLKFKGFKIFIEAD